MARTSARRCRPAYRVPSTQPLHELRVAVMLLLQQDGLPQVIADLICELLCDQWGGWMRLEHARVDCSLYEKTEEEKHMTIVRLEQGTTINNNNNNANNTNTSSTCLTPSIRVLLPRSGAETSISDMLFGWTPKYDIRTPPAELRAILAAQPPMHQRKQAIECVASWNWARACDEDKGQTKAQETTQTTRVTTRSQTKALKRKRTESFQHEQKFAPACDIHDHDPSLFQPQAHNITTALQAACPLGSNSSYWQESVSTAECLSLLMSHAWTWIRVSVEPRWQPETWAEIRTYPRGGGDCITSYELGRPCVCPHLVIDLMNATEWVVMWAPNRHIQPFHRSETHTASVVMTPITWTDDQQARHKLLQELAHKKQNKNENKKQKTNHNADSDTDMDEKEDGSDSDCETGDAEVVYVNDSTALGHTLSCDLYVHMTFPGFHMSLRARGETP